MDFQSYLQYFREITEGISTLKPYDEPHYKDYTKLNFSRMNRWLKTGVVNESLVNLIKNIKAPQTWITITEPWCGDAAHSVPFIHLISELSPLINAEYELRDSPPFRIEKYLSNGSKSIPVLIVKNQHGDDIFTWGSRPAEAELLRNDLISRKTDPEEIRTALQQWYNKDKGHSLQKELLELLNKYDNR